jgi:sodium-independent sulfate anion transporter 11
VTAAQALIDLRNQFNRYASPDQVEWHFAGVSNRWTKRALVASGFGTDSRRNRVIVGSAPSTDDKNELEPLIGAADVGGDWTKAGGSLKGGEARSKAREVDIEAAGADAEVSPVSSKNVGGRRLAPIYGVNRPFFHIDIETAVASTVQNLQGRGSEWSGRE